MSQTTDFDIIIIGSGPAGISAAMNILRVLPGIQDRLLVIDKAVHPREKPCGGGITPIASLWLKDFNVHLDIEILKLKRTRIIFDQGEYIGIPFKTVHRKKFDQALVQEAINMRIQISQGEQFKSIVNTNDQAIITTSKREITTEILIGADGSNSMVRKYIYRSRGKRSTRNLSRTLMVMKNVARNVYSESDELEAVFDFRFAFEFGLMGYSWSFPFLYNNQQWLNLGVLINDFSNSKKWGILLNPAFDNFLSKKGIAVTKQEIMSHPIHWFHPSSYFSSNRIILVGDAAGVDPLVGDGIPFALRYGQPAAAAVKNALSSGDFTFSTYKEELLQHEVGLTLQKRLTIAEDFYYTKNIDNFVRYFSLNPASCD